jgi:hypothetical protein
MFGVGVKKNSTLNKSTFNFSIDINIEFINFFISVIYPSRIRLISQISKIKLILDLIDNDRNKRSLIMLYRHDSSTRRPSVLGLQLVLQIKHHLEV